MIGLDPELRDPAGGDYRPAVGSAAAGYGCQTFGVGTGRADLGARAGAVRLTGAGREAIDVGGSIDVDTTWDAALVRVVDDVVIEDGARLTIPAGVRVEFQGFYRIDVRGSVRAEGTPTEMIVFTAAEPELFSIDAGTAGCWNALWFDETRATNGGSQLVWCVFEYSKAAGVGGGMHPYGGGAVSVRNFARLIVANCVFRHNVARYGGAVFLYEHADITLVGNLIVGNHALENAAAIYCAYSYPRLVNNTIVGNIIHNEQTPYVSSCALLNFNGKPVLGSNIVRGNEPEVSYNHAQLRTVKAYYVRYNNISGYADLTENIDSAAGFVDSDGPDGNPFTLEDNDYRLSAGSACIDAGDGSVLAWDVADLDGDGAVDELQPLDLWGGVRMADDPLTEDTGRGHPAFPGLPVVDMGAYEYGGTPSLEVGDLNCDGLVDHLDIDPFVLALTDAAGYGSAYPGCDLQLGDMNGDGAVDNFDIDGFVAVLGGR